MRETKEKNEKLLQWHQAFYAGLQIEFQSYAGVLIFENEYMLGTKPMQIDVLVVKKEPKTKIEKNIGRIFRTYNIFEYKSPDDYLSTDDFYKVYGYCCFYKSDTIAADEIKIDELTITLVCYHYPRAMIRHLQEKREYLIEQQEAGIYYIMGDIIPMQLIVVPELTDEKNLWLHSLTNRIGTSKSARQLVDEYEEHKQNRLYESVMELIVRSNQTRFQEVDSMCQALYDLFKDQLEEMARQMAEQKVEEIVEQRVEKIAEQRVEQIAEQRAEQIAEQRAEQIAEQRAEKIAEQRAEQIAEQRAEEISAQAYSNGFSGGETATLLSQIEKKIKKRKPLSVIADELEETEEVLLPLYNRVNARLAAQA